MKTTHIKSVIAKEDDTAYQLSPKGCALSSLIYSGCMGNFDEGKFEKFWSMFEYLMKQNGYIHE